MKLIPKFLYPWKPISFNNNLINLIDFNGSKFRLNDTSTWKNIHPRNIYNNFPEINTLDDILNLENWMENFTFYKDNNGNYKMQNILNPNMEMYHGTYNPKTKEYSYYNLNYTPNQVSDIKKNNYAYLFTTKGLFSNVNGNRLYDDDALTYYNNKLKENKTFDLYFTENWLGDARDNPRTRIDRRNDGYNADYSSLLNITIPRYYINDPNGERHYVGWGQNIDLSKYPGYKVSENGEYDINWSKGLDGKFLGIIPYDIELVPKSASKQLYEPNQDIDLGYRDIDLGYIEGIEDQLGIKNTDLKNIPNADIVRTAAELEAEHPGAGKFVLDNRISNKDQARKAWDEYNKNNNNSNNKNKQINPYVLSGLRVFLDNQFNTINTENLIKNMDVALKNYTPIGRLVHGDYVALQQALRKAAGLINRSPVTSNAQILSAIDLEAILKGNQIIEGGDLRDAQVYWNTAEAAFLLGRENTLKLDDLANFNRNALAEFNNKIAELRYLTNKQNMQNWDTFSAEIEQDLKRKKQIEEYKQILAQEAFETLHDTNYGVDTTRLEKLQQELWSIPYTKTEERRAKEIELNEETKRITALRALNKFRRYGWDLNEWRKLYKYDYNPSDFIIKNKLGGILLILQKGGGFGVLYTATGSFSPYDLMYGKGNTPSEKKSKSSSSSDDSEDEKTKTQLMKSIAETLKGVDGLDSDVNVLSQELMSFFDYTKYSLDDDPSKFYSMYVKALTRVNLVKLSAKRFDASFQQLEKTNSLNTPAITSTGGVIVGIGGSKDVSVVSVEDYFNNTDKYHLLTNGELLELRRRDPSMAFSDNYLTLAAQNGTSLQEIEKYVKDIISNLGSDLTSTSELTRRFGTQGFLGLKTLLTLVQGGLTNLETAQIIAALNGLGEYTVSTTQQAKLVMLALSSVFAFMPPNMRTLLSLYSGGKENSEKVILGLITKGVSSKIDFKINGFTQLDENGQIKSGSTKSGSGSGSGGSDKDPKETTATKWAIRGFGEKRTFDIVGTGQSAWRVTGNTLPITDDSDKKVGLTTLVDVSKAFGGTLDLEHVFMGNSRISSLALSLVLVETGDITRVALPIDINTPDYKRPWFDRLKLVSDADAELLREGIDATSENLTNELKSRVNQVYYNHKLPDKFNSDGSLNELKYAYFGLLKGMVKESSFEEGDEFNRDYLIKATDKQRDQFKQAMNALGDKNFKIDNGSLWGLLGGEEVYRGTIFIPIRTNIHNTQSGFGTTYSATPGQDTTWETLQQKHDALEEKGGAVPITKTNFDQ